MSKCAITDCPHEAKDTNRVTAVLIPNTRAVELRLCDEHFEEVSTGSHLVGSFDIKKVKNA
jgi:hypothetical protein